MENNATEKFMVDLLSSEDFERFYEDNVHNIRVPALSEYLSELCEQKNIKPRGLIKGLDIERSFGYKIFSGNRRLSRDNALKLALGLGLTVDETQKLLTVSKNSPLYPRIPRDAAILYCISHGFGYAKTQESLFDWGMTVLGDNIKQDYTRNDTSDFAQRISPALPSELFVNYEIMERLSNTLQSETFLVKSRKSGEYLIAKLHKKSSAIITEEYAILSQLNNSMIPKAKDSFENDDVSCLIREYVEGVSLNKLVLPLEEQNAIDIGLQLCDILIYLHSQTPPVIHRDIKPQNVILDNNDRVHLIDFGISRKFSNNSDKDTFFIGTSGFAPPEQYGFMQTDYRSDIYSLGIFIMFFINR